MKSLHGKFAYNEIHENTPHLPFIIDTKHCSMFDMEENAISFVTNDPLKIDAAPPKQSPSTAIAANRKNGNATTPKTVEETLTQLKTYTVNSNCSENVP